MSVQERIERNVRFIIGDLYMQTIILQARLEDAEAALAALGEAEANRPRKNGSAREARAQ